MASSVLTFVIVGNEDHPIFEADLAAARGSDASVRDEQAGRHVAQLWHSEPAAIICLTFFLKPSPLDYSAGSFCRATVGISDACLVLCSSKTNGCKSQILAAVCTRPERAHLHTHCPTLESHSAATHFSGARRAV